MGTKDLNSCLHALAAIALTHWAIFLISSLTSQPAIAKLTPLITWSIFQWHRPAYLFHSALQFNAPHLGLPILSRNSNFDKKKVYFSRKILEDNLVWGKGWLSFELISYRMWREPTIGPCCIDWCLEHCWEIWFLSEFAPLCWDVFGHWGGGVKSSVHTSQPGLCYSALFDIQLSHMFYGT